MQGGLPRGPVSRGFCVGGGLYRGGEVGQTA